jgi:hypothetical protein
MRPPYSGVVKQGANPIVLGRKFCSGCGRWRQVNEFPRMRRAAGAGLRARCWGCIRTYQRNLYRNMTLEQQANLREYQRIWDQGERRRQGTPTRRRSTVVDRVERVFLESAPLLNAIQEHVARDYRNGFDPSAPGGLLGGWELIAMTAGIDSRVMRRIRSGESRRVRLDIADRIAVALDIPLALLYPP